MAEHDGRVNAWWEAQRQWNASMEHDMVEHSRRLTALEKRIIFISGAAAAIGSLVGALMTGLMQ